MDKSLRWLALLTSGALIIAACGAQAPGRPSASAATTPSVAATPSGATDPASITGTITWSYWSPPKPLPEVIDAVADFNKTYPNVKVEYQLEPFGDYIRNVPLRFAAGDAADVPLIPDDSVTQYVDRLEDLTPYAVKTWGADWRSRFVAGSLDQMIVGGKLVGLPQFTACAGSLFYNKTIFDKAGVKAPKTFDELVQVVADLKSKGVKTPFVQGAKDAWINLDMFNLLASATAPGVIYKANAGTKPWTDPGLVAAMTKWQELFTRGVMQAGALGAAQYPDAWDAFLTQKAAMALNGTWTNFSMTRLTMDQDKKRLGFTEDYMILPINFPAVNGQPVKYACGAHAMTMNKVSKNKDAAWAFLSWYVSGGGQKWIAKKLRGPVISGLAVDTSDVIYPEQKQAIADQAKYIESGGYGGVRNFFYPEIKTALGNALQSVAGGKSPEQALKDVESVSKSVKR